jgi:hypothetical protein
MILVLSHCALAIVQTVSGQAGTVYQIFVRASVARHNGEPSLMLKAS